MRNVADDLVKNGVSGAYVVRVGNEIEGLYCRLSSVAEMITGEEPVDLHQFRDDFAPHLPEEVRRAIDSHARIGGDPGRGGDCLGDIMVELAGLALQMENIKFLIDNPGLATGSSYFHREDQGFLDD